ncbi:MAG: HAD hydrolase family protein, partial [Veillonella sp.]
MNRFFVTLNGAYIEDKKGQVIYQHQIEKSELRSISLGPNKRELSMVWLGVMMPS